MKKYLIIAVLILCHGRVQSQTYNYLRNLITQTANEAAGSVTDLQTQLDAAFFNGFGQNDIDLMAAIKQRGISASDYTTLAAALNAAAVDSNFVIVAAPMSLNDVYTIPAHVGLVIAGGSDARISLDPGVTLYVNGFFWAPPNQKVFFGEGNVIFGSGVVSKVYPEWWGAKADSTGDSGPAIKKAFTAAPTGAVLELSAGVGYTINTTVRVPSDKNVTVNGNGAVIYSSAADTLFLIQNGSQASVPSYAISPTTLQPRHIFNNIRFRRIAGATGTGVAIALINSTAQTFNNIDVTDYNNAFVFHNISSGWCENNEIFNSRIAGCDTAISYMLSQSGNNSMATNSLRKVTITRFTDSDVINQGAGQAVGIYSDTGTNLYRNVWDQVTIFPKDSVTCVNIDGKAEDLTGTVNFEYIGTTNNVRMRGFHFGPNSSELRFKLHVDLTGRLYFPVGGMFYSEIPGSYGYSGITTSFSGGNNHGNEVVVDSSKFTTIFGIVRNNSRLNKNTQGDSARIFFANVNNSGAGKLDLRARRNAPVEFRSITDNVYSAPTANTLRNSALPLQPVGLLDIGGNRSLTWTNPGTANDSSTIDVRNTTHLILASSGSVQRDTLTAFKGGIAGHTLTVNFASDSIVVLNLSGASGSGRLFLLDNINIWAQSGMKSVFKCESESGGVFWRELSRTSEYSKTENYSSTTVDSIDAAQVNFIRLNLGSAGTIRNFFNGIDGQLIEVLHRNGNATMAHLGRGTSKGLSMIDSDSLVGFTGLKQVFRYDAADQLWRETSRSSGLRVEQGTMLLKNLTESSATNVVSISVASGSYVGGYIDYTVFASDGTDHQARSGRVAFQAVNKAGTETAVVSGTAGNTNPTELQDGSSPAVSGGTLTYAWDTSTTPTNGFILRLTAISSLTQTTLSIRSKVTITSGTATVN